MGAKSKIFIKPSGLVTPTQVKFTILCEFPLCRLLVKMHNLFEKFSFGTQLALVAYTTLLQLAHELHQLPLHYHATQLYGRQRWQSPAHIRRNRHNHAPPAGSDRGVRNGPDVHKRSVMGVPSSHSRAARAAALPAGAGPSQESERPAPRSCPRLRLHPCRIPSPACPSARYRRCEGDRVEQGLGATLQSS